MKLKVWVSTNKVGSKCEMELEIDDLDLEQLDDDESRLEFVEEACKEEVLSMIEWDWQKIEEQGDPNS